MDNSPEFSPQPSYQSSPLLDTHHQGEIRFGGITAQPDSLSSKINNHG